jgi:hypothetical protein
VRLNAQPFADFPARMLALFEQAHADAFDEHRATAPPPRRPAPRANAGVSEVIPVSARLRSADLISDE